MRKYRSTIEIAEKIIALTEEARKKLPYNINVIDELHANENAHSRILCKLLQYKDHEGRYRILESFLHYIAPICPSFDDIKVKQPKITQEIERIDLWIRDKDDAIILENKVCGAIDQDYQLARYIDVTKKEGYKQENIYIIYLPADNHDPTDDSWGKYKDLFINRYAKVSFREDIIPWLKDKILPHCTIKEDLLISAVQQYVDYLEGLFHLRISQQKMYNMDNSLKDFGIVGNSFKDQLPDIDKLISDLTEARKVLQEYKSPHVSEVVKTFIQAMSDVFRDEDGWGKSKEHMSDDNGWYYFYNRNWGTDWCVHLEWSCIKIEDLFRTETYKMVLHVEGKYSKDEKFIELLKTNLGSLCDYDKKNTFWAQSFNFSKPICDMPKTELRECLENKVFNDATLQCVIQAIEKTAQEYKLVATT